MGRLGRAARVGGGGAEEDQGGRQGGHRHWRMATWQLMSRAGVRGGSGGPGRGGEGEAVAPTRAPTAWGVHLWGGGGGGGGAGRGEGTGSQRGGRGVPWRETARPDGRCVRHPPTTHGAVGHSGARARGGIPLPRQPRFFRSDGNGSSSHGGARRYARPRGGAQLLPALQPAHRPVPGVRGSCTCPIRQRGVVAQRGGLYCFSTEGPRRGRGITVAHQPQLPRRDQSHGDNAAPSHCHRWYSGHHPPSHPRRQARANQAAPTTPPALRHVVTTTTRPPRRARSSSTTSVTTCTSPPHGACVGG